MHLTEIFKQHHPAVSFEFFPPKTDEAADTLVENAIKRFAPLGPSYITVTYGAGGTTRERTREVVTRLNRDAGITTVPHLTCVGHTKDEIGLIVQNYVDAGIENIVALRGDKQEDDQDAVAGFTYASELVEFIKREFPKVGIAVAGYPEGHPETPNQITDVANLKRKIDAGADAIITQLFFDNRDYYDFVDRCNLKGIDVPIAAGLMPIRSMKGIMRMAGLSGARLPAPLLRSLMRTNEEPDAIKNVGAHWATEQCRDLLDHNVAGIHLYTLNTSAATRKIYESLGIRHTEALQQ